MRTQITDEVQEDEVTITVKEKPKTETQADKKEVKTAGRKMDGKTPVKHKIAFYVDDEQLAYLASMVVQGRGSKLKTENAVAKEIFLRDYQLHANKKD
jgi:hypothetical protein